MFRSESERLRVKATRHRVSDSPSQPEHHHPHHRHPTVARGGGGARAHHASVGAARVRPAGQRQDHVHARPARVPQRGGAVRRRLGRPAAGAVRARACAQLRRSRRELVVLGRWASKQPSATDEYAQPARVRDPHANRAHGARRRRCACLQPHGHCEPGPRQRRAAVRAGRRRCGPRVAERRGRGVPAGPQRRCVVRPRLGRILLGRGARPGAGRARRPWR